MKISKHLRKILRLLKAEDGPTTVEYAVMLSLIIALCIGTIRVMATATRDNFDDSAEAIQNAMSP